MAFRVHVNLPKGGRADYVGQDPEQEELNWLANVPEGVWAQFQSKEKLERKTQADGTWFYEIGLTGESPPVCVLESEAWCLSLVAVCFSIFWE